jgi:3-oxoacyl-[acyl-carrier-protein] synthase II
MYLSFSPIHCNQKGIIPPTLNLEDSAFPKLDIIGLKARETRLSAALSNSFGFGGTNCSLCFQKLKV